jgi:hypothetical protein
MEIQLSNRQVILKCWFPNAINELATTNDHIFSFLHNPKIQVRQFHLDKSTSSHLPGFNHLDNFAVTRKLLLIYRDKQVPHVIRHYIRVNPCYGFLQLFHNMFINIAN